MKVVVNKFGTAVQAATTAARKTLVTSAWVFVVAARQGRLGKENSLEPFVASEDEEEDGEGARERVVTVVSRST